MNHIDKINQNRAKLGLKPITGSKNLELIGIFMPEATCLATFKQWQKAGRKIIKGQKSLHLKGANYKTDEKTGEPVLTGYYNFCVFDYAQTEPFKARKTTTGGN